MHRTLDGALIEDSAQRVRELRRRGGGGVVLARGAFVVEINPEPTPAGADVCLREPAEVALDELARRVG